LVEKLESRSRYNLHGNIVTNFKANQANRILQPSETQHFKASAFCALLLPNNKIHEKDFQTHPPVTYY
jgi:hypothetical protein